MYHRRKTELEIMLAAAAVSNNANFSIGDKVVVTGKTCGYWIGVHATVKEIEIRTLDLFGTCTWIKILPNESKFPNGIAIPNPDIYHGFLPANLSLLQ